jgi:subtilisin-like proprotein convertase family protein
LLLSQAASAVVPNPQFNCVPSQPTTFTNPNDVAIPDPPDLVVAPTPITSTINVSGLTGRIYDLDVTTRIPHETSGDLVVDLTSPSGKVVELTLGNGGVLPNVFNGTVWDDGADPGGQAGSTSNARVTDHAYVGDVVASPLVPQDALASFMGDDPNGTWTLTVVDADPVGVGHLDEWSLSIATNNPTNATSGAGGVGPALTISDGLTRSSFVSITANGRRIKSLSLTLNGSPTPGSATSPSSSGLRRERL